MIKLVWYHYLPFKIYNYKPYIPAVHNLGAPGEECPAEHHASKVQPEASADAERRLASCYQK